MLTTNTFERRIQRLLTDAFGNLEWEYRDGTGAAWVPPVDIFEDPEAIRIALEVPGVRPEDVTISLENNTLKIHGAKQQAEQRTERVHRYERTYGTFERIFSLPTRCRFPMVRARRTQASFCRAMGTASPSDTISFPGRATGTCARWPAGPTSRLSIWSAMWTTRARPWPT